MSPVDDAYIFFLDVVFHYDQMCRGNLEHKMHKLCKWLLGSKRLREMHNLETLRLKHAREELPTPFWNLCFVQKSQNNSISGLKVTLISSGGVLPNSRDQYK